MDEVSSDTTDDEFESIATRPRELTSKFVGCAGKERADQMQIGQPLASIGIPRETSSSCSRREVCVAESAATICEKASPVIEYVESSTPEMRVPTAVHAQEQSVSSEPQLVMDRCSACKGNWRCKNVFPREMILVRGTIQQAKLCPHHRALGRKNQKTPLARERIKKDRQRPERKAKDRERAQRPENRAKLATRQKISKATEHRKTQERGYRTNEKGKIREKKAQKKRRERIKSDPGLKLMHNMRSRMNQMLRLKQRRSGTFSSYTAFADGDAVRRHIESTWLPGMTWENHGWRGTDIWNVGHRIALAMYDGNSKDDMRRCWSPQNMFAQWSIENQLLGVQLPSDSELLQMRDVWPASWSNELPDAAQRQTLERSVRNVFGAYSN